MSGNFKLNSPILAGIPEFIDNCQTTSFAVTDNLKKTIKKTQEKVDRIVKECYAKNQKFRDREFDLFVNSYECLYKDAKENCAYSDVRRGVESNDINHVSVGNCWFIASLGTITCIPGLLEKICAKRDEKFGIYGFIFSRHCSNENETRLPLIEKAYAKMHGDYESISGGYTGQGIEDLTGGVYNLTLINDILDTEKYWNEELKNVNNRVIILRTVEIEDGKKLILIRNPHGQTECTGRWSDGDNALNHRFGDDGAFWMSYEDFLEHWQLIDKFVLFDESWTVYLTWVNYNVVPKSEGKFVITLPEKTKLVIVLQQPDDRYFNIGTEYDYQLSFRVYKKGCDNYLFRSGATVLWASHSINLEVELLASDYEIVLGIERHQGEFPTNKKQDSECNDPEADTNTIYPKEEDKEEKENMEDLQ
ncbi:2606_t:CDS:2 [Entrophospora sp. SA101]|nr:9208_t:CDS:2 [Entrophospora sp. SA101]CAJ0760854.1 2606_t:CDS:2 [Entrophospora sp. SA101]